MTAIPDDDNNASEDRRDRTNKRTLDSDNVLCSASTASTRSPEHSPHEYAQLDIDVKRI